MEADQNFARRTRGYWMVDGLPELIMGSFFLLFSILQTLLLVAPPNISGFVALLIPVLMVVCTLVSRFTLQKMKARLTYPRTGYVEYPKPKRWQQMLGAVIGFGIGLASMALLVNTQFSSAWLPLITGFTLAFAMIYLGFYMGTARFYLLAAFASALSICLSLLQIDGFLGASLVLAFAGVWLLVSGGVTLRRYLQRTQPQE